MCVCVCFFFFFKLSFRDALLWEAGFLAFLVAPWNIVLITWKCGKYTFFKCRRFRYSIYSFISNRLSTVCPFLSVHWTVSLSVSQTDSQFIPIQSDSQASWQKDRQSVRQANNQAAGQLDSQSGNQTVNQSSLDLSVSQSVVSWSVCLFVCPSVSQSVSQSVSHSFTKLVCQSWNSQLDCSSWSLSHSLGRFSPCCTIYWVLSFVPLLIAGTPQDTMTV